MNGLEVNLENKHHFQQLITSRLHKKNMATSDLRFVPLLDPLSIKEKKTLGQLYGSKSALILEGEVETKIQRQKGDASQDFS